MFRNQFIKESFFDYTGNCSVNTERAGLLISNTVISLNSSNDADAFVIKLLSNKVESLILLGLSDDDINQNLLCLSQNRFVCSINKALGILVVKNIANEYKTIHLSCFSYSDALSKPFSSSVELSCLQNSYKYYQQGIVYMQSNIADGMPENQIKLLFRSLDFLSNNTSLFDKITQFVKDSLISHSEALSLLDKNDIYDVVLQAARQISCDDDQQILMAQKQLILFIAHQESIEQADLNKLYEKLNIITTTPSILVEEVVNEEDPFGVFEPRQEFALNASVRFFSPRIDVNLRAMNSIVEESVAADVIASQPAAESPIARPYFSHRRMGLMLSLSQLNSESLSPLIDRLPTPPAPRQRRRNNM